METTTGFERITTEVRGHVLVIGLNRPDKLNAFDAQMLRELAAAYTMYEQTHDLWCGVLFAHGRAFTSGLDLAAMIPVLARGESITPAGSIDPWGVHGPALSKPMVCAVHGRCLTAGIELMLACDIRVAAHDTIFAQIEIKRGILPFGGATIRMPQEIGWGNAMRYLLTGDEFSAEEAYRLGLVQEVVEPGAELARALVLAETVAQQAPLGVQGTLALARQALREGPAAAAASLLPALQAIIKTEDAQEGVLSFLQRRPGRFGGR